MRARHLVPLILLTACSDQRISNPGPAIHPHGTDSKRHERGVGEADARWSAMSATERTAGLRVIQRMYAEQGAVLTRPRIGIAAQALPGGARGAIVREPSRSTEPLLVLSPQDVNSATLSRLLPAMARIIQLDPEPNRVRVLLLKSDFTLIDDETAEPFPSGELKLELDVVALLRNAVNRGTTTAPRVGTVTVYAF